MYQGLTVTMTEQSTNVHATQQLATLLSTFRITKKKCTLCLSHLQYKLHLPVFISLHNEKLHGLHPSSLITWPIR